MSSGVYAIVHLGSARRYIGSSFKIERRFNQHRALLNTGVHPNPRLQRTWLRDGVRAFSFDVIELVADRALLKDAEQRHLDSAGDHVFNVDRTANTPTGRYPKPAGRKPRTNEWRENIRRSLNTEEAKARISAGVRKAFPNGRPPFSEEHRRNMSVARIGKPHKRSEQGEARRLAAARSPEARARLSVALKTAYSDGRMQAPKGREKGSLSESEKVAARARIVAFNKARKGYTQTPEHVAKRVIGRREALRKKRLNRLIAEANALILELQQKWVA